MTSGQPVEGRLFNFGSDPHRQIGVFITGKHSRCILVIGGQTDGFFSLGFLRVMMDQADQLGWSTVQVQLPSSCAGHGGRTHHGDSEDIAELVGHLNVQYEMAEIALLAWSTGVQVAIEVLGTRQAEVITRVILQGVVTAADTPMFLKDAVAARVRLAKEMYDNGDRERFVPREVYDLPLSAARLSTGGYPTLQEAVWVPVIAGDSEVLADVLGRIKAPLQLLVAFHPDFHPSKAELQSFTESFKGSAATKDVAVDFFDPVCDENRRLLRGCESQLAAAVLVFLKEQDKKREAREELQRQLAAEELRRSRSILARSLLK